MKLFTNSLSGGSIPFVDKSGIVFNYDDTIRINSIYAYFQNYGRSNGWKSSLMVNDILGGNLSKVNIMVDEGGCEMANHTVDHYSTPDIWMETNTAEEYYIQKMLPVEDIMVENGMTTPFSFAWPTGATNMEIYDYILGTGKYGIVRAYSKQGYPPGYPPDVSQNTTFYSGGNWADPTSMESYYGAFATDLDYHKANMDYAKATNQVYITLAHDIKAAGTFNPDTELAVTIEDLNEVVDYANTIGLNILTNKEAYNLHN